VTEVRPEAHAHCVLGSFYLRGERGKPQEYTEAARVFRLAAEQGRCSSSPPSNLNGRRAV
jgi:TPR repeat protein